MESCAFVRRYLCLPGLLCIPLYLAFQANEVLSNAEAYRTWESQSRIHGGQAQMDEECPRVPPPVYRKPSPQSRTQTNDDSPSTSNTNLKGFQPVQKFRSFALESSWATCVDLWRKHWRITSSVAFTILAASLPLLQTPGTNGDPLTRFFVYLFLFRLFFALLSSGVLLYYFSKDNFRSGNFAMIWGQHVKRQCQSCLYMPWTLLALPLVAISWGSIFVFIAVFLSVWGNGLYPNLPSVGEVYPLMIISLRVIITAMSVADIGWIWWLVARMRAFDQASKAIPGSV